jgi:hypothetical protein
VSDPVVEFIKANYGPTPALGRVSQGGSSHSVKIDPFHGGVWCGMEGGRFDFYR